MRTDALDSSPRLASRSKMTCITRGTMPGSSAGPLIVYVFPELVMPYAKSRPLCPSKSRSTRGDATRSKTSCCAVSSPRTPLKVYCFVCSADCLPAIASGGSSAPSGTRCSIVLPLQMRIVRRCGCFALAGMGRTRRNTSMQLPPALLELLLASDRRDDIDATDSRSDAP